MAVTDFPWCLAPFWLRSAARMGQAAKGDPDLVVQQDHGSWSAARKGARDSRDTFSIFGFDKVRFLALAAGWLCGIHLCNLCAGAAEQENAKLDNAALHSAELSNPDVIAMGKKRFNRTCFYCHGYEGVGGKGATLQRRLDLSPDIIFNTISNGRIRGSAVMPPWKNTLTEEEISQLVAYILSLREMPEQK
jgi:mono/diheme cytochrome c family protein